MAVDPITGQEMAATSNPFEADAEVSTEIADITQQDYLATVGEPKKEVGMIDTGSAVTQVNKDQAYLDEVSPVATTTEKTPSTSDAQPTETTTEVADIPKTAEQKAMEIELDQAVSEVENLTRDFLNYNVDQDPEFQAQAANIKTSFDKMRREMEQINYQRKRAYETLGFRTGSTQYAGEISMGIVGEEITQGNERMAEISRQETQAISAARTAFKNNEFTEFNAKVSALRDIRDQKANELATYNQALVNAADQLRKDQQAELDNQLKSLQIKELGQKIIQSNIDTFASGFLDLDPTTGEVSLPSPTEIQTISQQTGISVGQLTSTFRSKAYELSKLSQEDRKREADIAKAQNDLIPSAYQEYNFAVENGFDGDFFDYLASKESATQTAPSSYREWQLAGGESGTGKTYADFLGAQNGLDPKTITQIDALSKGFDNSPIVKNFVEVQNKKLGVDRILSSGVGGPADLALVFDFMKALDPTSVVREAEYDSAAKSGNIFSGVFAKFNGYLKEEGGFLPDKVKKEFQNLVNQKYDAVSIQYDNLLNETARKINIKTGTDDGEQYLTQYKFDFEKADPTGTLDNYYISNPEARSYIDKLSGQYTDEEILQILGVGKSEPLGMGIKGSDVSGIKDFTKVNTIMGQGVATGIESGSKFWKYGYDLVLNGGKGAPVKSPYSGTVVQAKADGAWGNSVKIKLDNGEVIRLSHLDNMDVRPGQKIKAGTVVGGQGNTGKTYGPTGIHVDITMYGKDGKPLNSQRVASLLNTQEIA